MILGAHLKVGSKVTIWGVTRAEFIGTATAWDETGIVIDDGSVSFVPWATVSKLSVG